jgi:hypothetical protein
MIFSESCCEQAPDCCPDISYELRVFVVKNNARTEKYFRVFYRPESFTARIPGNVFDECGLYEIEGVFVHCGNRTSKVLSRFVDEKPAVFNIVSLSDNCCECVEIGTLVELKASGDFPSIQGGQRAGRWLLYCDDDLVRDTGFRPDVHLPFRFVPVRKGVHRVVFEYRNYCGTIRRVEKQFTVLGEFVFFRLGCEKFKIVKPCTKNPYDKSYEIYAYKKGEKIPVFKGPENSDVEFVLPAGVYQTVEYSDADFARRRMFVNLCPLDDCMEQILDMFLCVETCQDLRTEIDFYYGQISFLWNYVARLNMNLRFCLDEYCESEEDAYFVLADIIDKLSEICKDCFEFKKQRNCGCEKVGVPVKRTLKQ